MHSAATVLNNRNTHNVVRPSYQVLPALVRTQSENQTKQEAKKHELANVTTAKQTESAPVEVYLHLCEHKVKYHSIPLPVRTRRRS